jgi:hypothetical protein
MSPTYQNLYKEGRTLMLKASDKKGHDHNHAKKVQQNAELILSELLEREPKKYKIENIENMVLTAAWWHDSYKRKHKKFSLYAIFNEGQEAEKIFLNSTHTSLLPDDEKAQIAHAIRYHHQPYKFMFNWRGMPPVTRILLEADGVETFRLSQIPKLFKKASNPFIVFLYIFFLSGLLLSTF